MIDGILDSLPAWALLIVAIVWVSYQFVSSVLERQEKKKEDEARDQYRRSRNTSEPSVGGVGFRPEDTGRHVRQVFEEEREREQRIEIVGNTRDHAEAMKQLVAAEGQQTQLLRRLVDMQEQQLRAQESSTRKQDRQDLLVEQVVEMLRVLTNPPGSGPGARVVPLPIRHKEG